MLLFDLPDDDSLYEALLRRDPSYDGRAYVCVASTGIFCRLTCPARKPLRKNCMFRETVAECLEAGFRPCKRCFPLEPAANSDPVIKTLLDALDADPRRRWSERDIVDLGLDPSTVRRAFQRHFGMTFLAMARLRRVGDGLAALSNGARVIDAQLDAGFDSPSGFRDAFARLLGVAPGTLRRDAMLRADWIDTPLGAMIVVSDTKAVHLLEFADRKGLPRELTRLRDMSKGAIGLGRFKPSDRIETELEAYFAGKSARFQTDLVFHGTPFVKQVWTELRAIPAGATRSYGELARAIGKPQAVRAVARANGANQIAIAVPCHRVIGADGSLTGYGGGLWRKQKLIEIEQHYATDKERCHGRT